MKNKYALQELKENMAKALIKDAEVSTKASIETANFLRGKTTEKAKTILKRVLEKKQAIPFKRFTDGVGHRAGAGIAAGRYPQKVAKEFMKLIEAAEANAQNQGLSTNLKIIHLLANKASNQFHYGRQSRRKYKRTHLEIVVEEQEEEQKPKKQTKKSEAKKETPTKKTEQKPEIKKKEEKKETNQTRNETEEKKTETKAEKEEPKKGQKTESSEDKK